MSYPDIVGIINPSPSNFLNYFSFFTTKFWDMKPSAQHQRTISMLLLHHPPHMKPSAHHHLLCFIIHHKWNPAHNIIKCGAPSLCFCFIIHRYDHTIQGMFTASTSSPFLLVTWLFFVEVNVIFTSSSAEFKINQVKFNGFMHTRYVSTQRDSANYLINIT